MAPLKSILAEFCQKFFKQLMAELKSREIAALLNVLGIFAWLGGLILGLVWMFTGLMRSGIIGLGFLFLFFYLVLVAPLSLLVTLWLCNLCVLRR